METGAEPRAPEPVAGLIVEDADGSFYAIAWADLIRFRIPAAFAPLLRTLTTGAEPGSTVDTDVLGFASLAVVEGTRALLVEAVGTPGVPPPAVHRLAAWLVLR